MPEATEARRAWSKSKGADARRRATTTCGRMSRARAARGRSVVTKELRVSPMIGGARRVQDLRRGAGGLRA